MSDNKDIPSLTMRRQSDGQICHPSHGTFHLLRLLFGSLIAGWSIILVLFILGFLGNIKFTDSIDSASKWLFIGGSALGIILGLIFAIISSIVYVAFSVDGQKIHPLSLVRAGFTFVITWPLIGLIFWPFIGWSPWVGLIAAIILAWLSVRSNPHSEPIPHSTLGRAIGTSVGPFLILAVILAIVIPMFNRGLGTPFKPKLIFVAVDGVDSSALDELVRVDNPEFLPNIRRLKEQGITGRTGGNEPLIPSRLWADIMTGRDAQAHGIFDRNSAPEDLKAQTLWEILGLSGYRIGLFRMMPPHEPFEPASFDILPPDSPDPLNNPYSVLIRAAKESGVPGYFPNPWDMASFTFRMARMGVKLDTLGKMAKELTWEILTSPSPTLVYVERKKLQFEMETEIALALLRTSSVDAAFLRFPELAPLFVDYWRYWKPSDFDRSGEVDTVTAAEFSRAIPDAYGLLDDLIGELDQYKKFGTILAIVSNYGERSPSARFRTNLFISPDSLIEITGFQDRILGDTSGSTAYFRLSPDDPNTADFDEFESLLTEAQWSNPSESEHSPNRMRKIFSVSRVYDRLDVTLTASSDLTPDSTLVIGERTGTLADIIEPPGARSAVLNASGLFFLEGYPFAKLIRGNNANPVDILPTILHAMGIGISTELNGRVMENLYDTGWFADHPIEYVDSYEAPEPESGEFGTESTVPEESTQESTQEENDRKILRPMSIRI